MTVLSMTVLSSSRNASAVKSVLWLIPGQSHKSMDSDFISMKWAVRR